MTLTQNIRRNYRTVLAALGLLRNKAGHRITLENLRVKRNAHVMKKKNEAARAVNLSRGMKISAALKAKMASDPEYAARVKAHGRWLAAKRRALIAGSNAQKPIILGVTEGTRVIGGGSAN